MSDALSLINYIFGKFVDTIFNQFEIFSNVTIGWILVVIIIFSILISNIVNIARANVDKVYIRHDEDD